jgi:hypothetical protein
LTSDTDVKEAAVRQAGLATGRRPMPELTIFVELVDTIIVVADVTLVAALNMPERRDGRCSTVKQPGDDLCEVGSAVSSTMSCYRHQASLVGRIEYHHNLLKKYKRNQCDN